MVHSVEVEFYTGPFSLVGQIDYPTDEGEYPAILIVPGTPQHDRYGTVKGYKAYNNYLQVLADTLLHAGYAVFRWDKGGTGKSSSGLSAPLNMVSAYRQMCNLPRIDLKRIGILGIAGGSAHIYRKWLEIEEINPLQHLILLGTGVNDLKIENLDVHIALIAGAGRILRSQQALQRYASRTGLEVLCYEEEQANEQLLNESKGKVNLFNSDDASWHPNVLDKVTMWLIKMQEL